MSVFGKKTFAKPTSEQVRYRCSECGRLLGISNASVGRMVACPACKAQTRVPNPGGGPLEARPADHWRVAAAEAAQAGSIPVAEEEEGFPIRAKRGEVEEMDLTPMVDVTFLLLIFFMITASFSTQKSLEVPPPDPETQGAAPIPLEQLEENSVIVRVEPEDQFFVDEQPVGTADDLPAAIAEAMSDGNRTELVIEAADAARHEAVVQVYDAGNEVGMQRIRLASPSGE